VNVSAERGGTIAGSPTMKQSALVAPAGIGAPGTPLPGESYFASTACGVFRKLMAMRL
jgi:hypothetical protein